MKEIKLWVKAKDVITGYIWIVTTIAKHLTWCDRVCLTPEHKKWELEDGNFFDINSLKYVWVWVVKHFKEDIAKPKDKWWPAVYKGKNIKSHKVL